MLDKVCIILVAVLAAVVMPARAQTAQQLYAQAEAALSNGDAARAVTLGAQARTGLGSTNPRIEGLLAQAYLADGDAVNARIAMDKLLRMVPASRQRASSFAPYRALDEQIDRALERAQREHEDGEKQAEQRAMREADEIASRYESARTVKVNRLKQAARQQQEAHYQQLRASDDTDALRAFAQAYPESQQAVALRNRAAEIEAERRRIANEPNVWAEAQRANTVAKYEEYLRIYPDGRWVADAREGLYQAHAKIQFQRARSSRSLSDYETYYNEYQRGADIETVRETLREAYLRFGGQHYDAKNWAAAKTYYQNYLVVVPAGSAEVTRRMERIDRMLRQHDRMTLMIAFHPNAKGFNLMDLLKDRTGMYFGARSGNAVINAPSVSSDRFRPIDEERAALIDGEVSEIEVDRYGASVWKYRYTRTGERKLVNAIGAVGITRKIFYPMWFNAGVNAGYREQWDELQTEAYVRTGASGPDIYDLELRDPVFVRDETVSSFAVGAEAGLTLFLGPVSFHYGASYLFGTVNHYWGIGFGPR